MPITEVRPEPQPVEGRCGLKVNSKLGPDTCSRQEGHAGAHTGFAAYRSGVLGHRAKTGRNQEAIEAKKAAQRERDVLQLKMMAARLGFEVVEMPKNIQTKKAG